MFNTPPQDIVRKSIIQVPEGRRIFPRMTVVENLEMGAYIHNDRSQIEKDMEAMFVRVSTFERTTKTIGRHTLRWRTTNVGDCAWTHGASRVIAAR